MNTKTFKYRPRMNDLDKNNVREDFIKLTANPQVKQVINHDSTMERNGNNFEKITNNYQNNKITKLRTRTSREFYIPDRRIVHFDLKGAAPKVSYLAKVFRLIEKAGATGILLEWEDMFPFEDDLSIGKHRFAYTQDDVEEILKHAKSSNLEVIPLVQTFGHLELFLKYQEFRSLRELDHFPQAICPSKDGSFELVKKIVDQVMAFHKDAQFIHIGCDEVFQLGECSKCRLKDRDELFLDHGLFTKFF